MSLCIEKVAAMECEYANDVARCDVDMNGTCVNEGCANHSGGYANP